MPPSAYSFYNDGGKVRFIANSTMKRTKIAATQLPREKLMEDVEPFRIMVSAVAFSFLELGKQRGTKNALKKNLLL